MTEQEFNEFLLSIGGVISEYNGEVIVDRHFFSVGDGWLPLVRDLVTKLYLSGWNKQLAQVKEKFGGLRFYTGALTTEQHQMIRDAENLSYATCEKCGAPGRLRQTGWWSTLCYEHAPKVNGDK
jgi:hypothetical protein